MTQLENLHADVFAAIALRYLAAGQVRLYEHLCKQPWFHAPSLLQVLDKAKATLPPGIEPDLRAGEAEAAADLAVLYERRWLRAFWPALIWRLLRSLTPTKK